MTILVQTGRRLARLALSGGIALSAGALALAAGLQKPPSSAKPDSEFFESQVKPILQASCASCHSGSSPMGDLALAGRKALLKGGASGPAINLQKPEASRLLQAVNYRGRKMPPSGRLPQAQIDILTRWVRMGAPWSAQSKPGAAPEQVKHTVPEVNDQNRRFWSFQPVRRPPVPAVKNTAWVRNPIDAFVLAKLEASGLNPAPAASRQALIRRAYYDMLGLPPTPEEVSAFVADNSPNAWEKVVDRILASPHYGEKWGRHWLDLVRYAETNSYERDGAKPFVWRYRDYVIKSLNDDKPYDRFVQEQLAGDEMGEVTPERLVATGYYRLGIWDDEPSDPQQALYDDLDDIVKTTGEVFLGLTVGCARCHDHKIDPMPQKDYYRFLAFFNGVLRYGVRSPESVHEASLRPIAPAAEVAAHRVDALAHRRLLQENQREIDVFERIALPDLTPVEKEEFTQENARAAIVRKRVPRLVTESQFAEYQRLVAERLRLREHPPRALQMALCVTEERTPRETHVLLRGNPHAEGDVVQPGFPTILGFPDPSIARPHAGQSSGRRLALAKWLTDPRNQLTPRVIVNRVWQYHFGRGIVRTPSNFGLQGAHPTHPELLDWLAATFTQRGVTPLPPNLGGIAPLPPNSRGLRARVPPSDRIASVQTTSVPSVPSLPPAQCTGRQHSRVNGPRVLEGRGASPSVMVGRRAVRQRPSSASEIGDRKSKTENGFGWRLKPLHRLILLSNAYRMSSQGNPAALAKDPENDLIWRFDMRRLTAEEVRDSILAVNGSLNPQMGGPGIYVTIPKEVLAGQSRPGDGWGDSPRDQQCRRTVYIHVKRSLITPIVASFDGPETDFSCPVRFATTQPTQALGLLNGAFLNREAGVLAEYLRKNAGNLPAAQVRLALQRVTQREPSEAEVARGVRLIDALRAKDHLSAEDALRQFCVVALNLNEFIYLD